MSISINSKILNTNNVNVPVTELKVGDKVWGMVFSNDEKHLWETEIIEITEHEDIVYDTNVNELVVSADQKMYISNKKMRPKTRMYKDLRRKDASYDIRIWPFDRTRNYSDLTGDFERGYLRGFVEGDGHMDRGINVFQKDKTAVDEIFHLYNDYINECNVNTRYIPSTDMYSASGGYTPIFLEKTDCFDNIEFLHGYLNGMIMSDGCAAYNKSNDSFGITIVQSLSANAEKCKTIQECLDKLHYKYDRWESHTGGFLEGGSHMISWRITRPFIIPLQYGTNKLNDVKKKISEYGSIRNFKSTPISMFKPGTGRLEKVVDIKTSCGSYFANCCLMIN